MLSSAKITKFKNTVLGQRFELSVVTIPPAKMKALSKTYRNINKATDILSFPLSKMSGEIFLCMSEVKTHAKMFGMTPEKYLPYLVIHGMVHLKGHEHGRIMDMLEVRYCKALNVERPGTTSKKNGTANGGRH